MFKILVRITLVLFSVIATYYFFYWLPLGLLQEILPSIPWLRTILSLCIALLTGWFIWKKTANRAMGFAKITSVSAITVGSIGFILGFFGPIIFVPESNLGPLLGLFITGPLGVVLGAIIGLIYWGIRREPKEVSLGVSDTQSTACFHGGSFFQSIGEDFQQLERRDSIINADVLDAWFPPAPGVLQRLREALPWVIRTSPPTAGTGMIDTISKIRGINAENICIGAGSSDLIYLAFHQWLDRSSRVLILDPMYGEYRHILEHVLQAEIDKFPLTRKNNYLVDLDRLLHVAQQGYDLVVLVNPNSPTGQYIPAEELQQILEKISGKTKIWIDETYIEYVGGNHSLEQFAAASDNTIVCKSMSKVYALSGVRAAYVCGPVHLMQELRVHNPPWAVSLPAQIAAVQALNDPGYYDQCYRDTTRFRTELATELRNIQAFDVIPGVANFLLCHIHPGFPDAPTLIEQCRQKGLFIRNAQNMGSELDDRVIRIAVKDQTTNQKMIDIFKEILF